MCSVVVASAAKQSNRGLRISVDCFAALATTKENSVGWRFAEVSQGRGLLQQRSAISPPVGAGTVDHLDQLRIDQRFRRYPEFAPEGLVAIERNTERIPYADPDQLG